MEFILDKSYKSEISYQIFGEYNIQYIYFRNSHFLVELMLQISCARCSNGVGLTLAIEARKSAERYVKLTERMEYKVREQIWSNLTKIGGNLESHRARKYTEDP